MGSEQRSAKNHKKRFGLTERADLLEVPAGELAAGEVGG